jgi:Secretion system C-terminal sorting domain/Kelch motif
MKKIIICFFLFIAFNAKSQSFWQDLTPLPVSVTNNAVTAAKVGNKPYVYSFAGMDSTKIWSGIHLDAWRLNVENETWSALPPVPDAAGGKIAASASTVKNKIYVIGGYHVAANGAEVSSNKVHRFDPESNTWLSDGTNIPVPIDDQVQAVWRDSLIYVVTGWSNTSNTPNVQIYNPSANTWAVGTPVPNTNNFKAFGASGVIVGDTIYYCGGAKTGTNFPAASILRKGAINPLNPTQINWTFTNTAPAQGYRMGAASMTGSPIWIGGSAITYNYDGIAYNGSGPVAPLDRILVYDKYNSNFLLFEFLGNIPKIMDLRGAAQISPNGVIIVGGMTENQLVSNRVGVINFAFFAKTEEKEDLVGYTYPNPTKDVLKFTIPSVVAVRVFNGSGKLCFEKKAENIEQISIGNLSNGVYSIEATTKNGKTFLDKIIKD